MEKIFKQVKGVYRNLSGDFKSALTNILWLFGDKILKVVSEILVGGWVAQYLGAEDFGLLNYAIAYAIIFNAISKFGITNILVRELVEKPNKKNDALGSAFVIRFFTTLFCICCFLILSYSIHQNDKTTFLILVIISLSLIGSLFETIDAFYQAMVKSKYMVLSKNIVLFSFIVIKVILILAEQPLEYFALAYSLEIIGFGLCMLLLYNQKYESLINWKFDFVMAKSLVRDSWPLMVSSLFISIYMRVDQIMLLYMSSEKEVGIYSAAIRISEAWNFIPVIICASFFPYILKEKKNESSYQNTLKRLYLIMIGASSVVIVVIWILADFIIGFLFGMEYIDSSLISRIHILGAPFGFLGVATSQYLVSENLTKVSLYRTLIGVIMNLILNYFLIPAYGGVGAAIATVFSYASVVLALTLFKDARGQIKIIFKAITFS